MRNDWFPKVKLVENKANGNPVLAKENLDRLDVLLERLCDGLAPDLPVSASGQPRQTPLGDVTALLAVTQGAKRPSSATAEEAA